MRRYTKARLKLNRAADKVRKAFLLENADGCECCGHGPDNPRPGMDWELSILCVHEILNAGFRKTSQAAPFAVLVVCYYCNQYELHNRTKWPRARQLAVLKRSREGDYNLPKFIEMWDRGPNAITQAEVDEWA